MIVLVANLGSTSFKYRLFDLPDAPGTADAPSPSRGLITAAPQAEAAG